MLKNVLVLIFFTSSILLSTLCLASTNQHETESVKNVVTKDVSLNANTTITNKLAITGVVKKNKTSDDTTGEDEKAVPAQTSFLMLLLSLLGFIALSNRRNV